jgi:hypothetical protein
MKIVELAVFRGPRRVDDARRPGALRGCTRKLCISACGEMVCGAFRGTRRMHRNVDRCKDRERLNAGGGGRLCR